MKLFALLFFFTGNSRKLVDPRLSRMMQRVLRRRRRKRGGRVR